MATRKATAKAKPRSKSVRVTSSPTITASRRSTGSVKQRLSKRSGAARKPRAAKKVAVTAENYRAFAAATLRGQAESIFVGFHEPVTMGYMNGEMGGFVTAQVLTHVQSDETNPSPIDMPKKNDLKKLVQVMGFFATENEVLAWLATQ